LMGRLIPAGTGIPRYKEFQADVVTEDNSFSMNL
jgi:hypothetical protein